MSQKKQDHTNTFYLGQFRDRIHEDEFIHHILNYFKQNSEIFGFGVYFNSNRTECSIVIKLKDVKSRNWLLIPYSLRSKHWEQADKIGDLGPKDVYQWLDNRGLYTFKTIPAIQFVALTPLASLVPDLTAFHDVEYNLDKFEKYGGNNSLMRQSSKKSRKQYRIRKTSRKTSRKNSRKMI